MTNILNINTDHSNNFDCILMFSGGKDSSYLLYYLSEIMKLRVLTVTIDHIFLPKETKDNIISFSNKFSKKHVFIENSYLNHSGKHFLEKWIYKPDAGSLITLCTGCRLGLVKLIIKTAISENVYTVVSGETTFEETQHKLILVNYPAEKIGFQYFILGYLFLIIRNPRLLSNIKAFLNQVNEFYYFKNKNKLFTKNAINFIRPYFNSIEYNEQKIIDTLNELKWKAPGDKKNGYWRRDCYMHTIRHCLYRKTCGYNEKEEYYSKLLENGVIDYNYYLRHTNEYETDDIVMLLKNLKIAKKSLDKYTTLLNKDKN